MIWLAVPLFTLLMAASWAGGYILGRRARVRWLVLGLVIAVLLITTRLLLRLYPNWAFHLLGADSYVSISPWWVFLPACFAAGVGSARMSTPRLRLLVSLFSSLLVIAGSQRLFLSLRISDEVIEDRAKDGIVYQTTSYSCGAAASATLLRRSGIPATEREMVGLCRTNAFTGTDELGVARGLALKLAGTGKKVDVVRASVEDLPSRPLPALATIKSGPWLDHWVVVLKASDTEVWLADPVDGYRRLSRERFARIWRRVLVTVE